MYQNAGTIPHEIPDVDVMLKLPPEELAGIVLRVVAMQLNGQRNGHVHPIALREKLRPAPYQWPGYLSRVEEAEEAFDEAWSWLLTQGLLIPLPNGNEYVRISRRGKSLTEASAFRNYAAGVTFQQSFLHPALADCWLDLARGDAEIAVFRAFKTLEVEIRTRAGYDKKQFGYTMVSDAFNVHTGPLRDKSNPVVSERTGERDLFCGAMGLIKNPASHRAPTVEEQQLAKEQLVFASLLLRILDDRPQP
jgi:uncharacterized protein (TIGR02391 family)